jgi:hypothetical protein
MLDDFYDPKGLAANVASDLVLLVNLHDNLGWFFH